MALVGEGDFEALFSSCVMLADGVAFLTEVGCDRFSTSFSNRPLSKYILISKMTPGGNRAS